VVATLAVVFTSSGPAPPLTFRADDTVDIEVVEVEGTNGAPDVDATTKQDIRSSD